MSDSQGQLKSTWTQEWASWKNPSSTKPLAPVPKVGDLAPVHPNLPLPSDKPTLMVFLRHCGCPFAEKTFRHLTTLSTHYPDVHFVAISHSSDTTTERWVVSVGGNWEVRVVVDEERELYSLWGLGVSSTWHVLNPVSLYKVFQLGQSEGIWNRPTESGTRWQTGGAFAVGMDGRVKWTYVSKSADDLPDLEEGLRALEVQVKEHHELKRKEGQSSGFL